MPTKTPTLKEIAFLDLERELAVTRIVLERLPQEHYKWKPHEKSMSLGSLALHVAFLPDWMRGTLAADVLDFSTAPRPPKDVADRAQLLGFFDKNVAALREAVAKIDMAKFDDPWSLTNGPQTIVTRPRSLVYRTWSLNHLIHHRGQLCLYLRLLNVPVPTIYFNTADDPAMKFE